jgi:hypothetical protein
MNDRRQGCLPGLLQLFFLNQFFDWAQRRFGFGRGLSCTGCGCGIVMLVVFVILTCQILTGTDWLRLY